MEFDWSPTEIQSTITTTRHEDGTYTSAEVVEFGGIVVVKVTDLSKVDGKVERFCCTQIFPDKHKATEWAEEMSLRLVNNVPGARRFPMKSHYPTIEPLDYDGYMGICKNADGHDDIIFYLSTINGVLEVVASDLEKDFSCAHFVATTEEAMEWAVSFVKKFRS